MNRTERLAELSDLLGVKVLGVDRAKDLTWALEQWCSPDSCYCRLRQPNRCELPRGWQPPFPHSVLRLYGRSSAFRNPRTLNQLADSPRTLVREDGHRAVKLMLEIWNPRKEK